MSYIKIALLWCAAACIALWAYLRLRRGKVTLLEGRFSPGLVRMIAIILVYLNGGCPEPRETNVATAKPQDAIRKIEGLQETFYMRYHLFQRFIAFFRMHQLYDFHLIELMQPIEAPDILSIAAGFATEAGCISRHLQGQLCFF